MVGLDPLGHQRNGNERWAVRPENEHTMRGMGSVEWITWVEEKRKNKARLARSGLGPVRFLKQNGREDISN